MLPLESFVDYVNQNDLFSKNDRILLAVSGGKDSVLMAHFFKQTGYDIGIAHCNFGLRAGESQRDEHFVRTLAAVLGVPFYVTHFHTKVYAAAQKISTQMAARDLRYHWFEQLRKEENFDRVAIAHHQDDATETVLLNLVRGTGIAGLHGILPKRDRLVRPLLFLSRRIIDELIIANEIEFVEDSSNGSANYSRNKIRLNVIPLLKEINPNLEQTFEHNIQRFAETEIVLQQMVTQVRSQICEEKHNSIYISMEKINILYPKKLLLFELLKDYNFTEAVLEELLCSLAKQSGTSFYSSSHRMTIDRKDLIISIISANVHENRIVHRGDPRILLDGQSIEITYADTVFFESDRGKAFVDEDLLIFPLVIRSWQEGDRFMPMGMKNYKNLSDFFIDQKIPLPEKEFVPILINGNGQVVWVVGLRQDNRYKVTATTKKVVIFEQNFN